MTTHTAESESQNASKEQPSGSGSSVLKSLLTGAGIGVAVVGLLVAGVVGVGVYANGWHGAVTRAVLSVVPYPAAVVDGSVVRLSTYVEDLEAIRRFFEQQKDQAGALGQLPTDEELKAQVIERLVSVEVLKAEAAKRDLTVSDQDVDAEFAKLSAAAGAIDQEIKDLYGWTTAQFKDKIVRPFLLTQKLAAALVQDQALVQERRAKADEVLAKLKSGEKFEDLAAAYSGDPSNAQNGGDLGWFGRGIMVQEFENGVFALKAGETSGLIETRFGIHIARLEEIKKAKDGTVEQVHARHILISGPNIDVYLKGAIEKAQVRKFVK